MVMEAIVQSWATAARADPRRGAAHAPAARRRSAKLEPSDDPLVGGDRAATPSPRCASQADMAQRRLRRGAEVPARVGARAAAGPRRDRGRRADARPDGGRRHLRPGRRRLRALLGRRRMARPALREDALRQRAARPRLPARLAGCSGTSATAAVSEQTLQWALREMRGPEGGFQSALDADSEGEEGRFYVWTPDEIREALAAKGLERPRRRGHELLRSHRARQLRGPQHPPPARRTPDDEPPEWYEEVRRALYSLRSRRVWPGRDDKRLTSWNALMIAALAEAGAALPCRDYLDAAVAAAEFVWNEMRDSEGRLLRTYKDGEAKLNAYLEDHAYLVEALLTLYEATFDVRWFDAARETADAMIERFADPEHGGFFTTVERPRGAGRAPQGRRRPPDPVGQLRRRARPAAPRRADRRGASTSDHAVGVLRLLHRAATRHPQALAHLLRAMDFHLAGVREVALVAPANGPAGRVARRPRGGRALALPPQRRARRRRGGQRAPGADARARRDRGQSRGLRVRALRLPRAGDRARGACRGARRRVIAL